LSKANIMITWNALVCSWRVYSSWSTSNSCHATLVIKVVISHWNGEKNRIATSINGTYQWVYVTDYSLELTKSWCRRKNRKPWFSSLLVTGNPLSSIFWYATVVLEYGINWEIYKSHGVLLACCYMWMDNLL
jgi:hypothetical protein